MRVRLHAAREIRPLRNPAPSYTPGDSPVNARKSFSFGKNWQRYLRDIDGERVREAERSLTGFLGLRDLAGRSVVDIGCGSGLFSWAAFRLGASRVVSIDIDPFSVAACRSLHEKAGSPGNWEVCEGSVLDECIFAMGEFDIVYSWGVLHHTGAMWRALAHAARLVTEGGFLYIAIYNRVDGIGGSRFWLRVKKAYNVAPSAGKYAMELLYMALFCASRFLTLRNPLKEIGGYRAHRGMSWRTDISDWLGGYPYECATVEEVFAFIRRDFHGIRLENIKTTNGLGNNWFLFRREPRQCRVAGGEGSAGARWT